MDGDFDLSDFVYDPAMCADEIAHEKVADEVLGITPRPDGFAVIDERFWEYYPPAARLITALHFGLGVFGPTEEGGWLQLSAALCDRFNLADRGVRLRALTAVEKSGHIEVRRVPGKRALLRFHPDGPQPTRLAPMRKKRSSKTWTGDVP